MASDLRDRIFHFNENLVPLKQLILNNQYPPDLTENQRRILRRQREHHMIKENQLYRKRRNKWVQIPSTLGEVMDILLFCHVTSGCHAGIDKTKSRISDHYYWRGMSRDVIAYISTCTTCQTFEVVKTQAPTLKQIKVSQPMEVVGMDLIGKKSDDPRSPDFVPSVFFSSPQQQKKGEKSLQQQRKGEKSPQRLTKRQQSVKLKKDKARLEAAAGSVDLPAKEEHARTDEAGNSVNEDDEIPSESDSDTVSITYGMLDYEEIMKATVQECQELRERNFVLNETITKLSLSEHSFQDYEKVIFYTGLGNFTHLKGVTDLIAPVLKPGKLTAFQQVLLCLMKLRLNLDFKDLGYRFGVDQAIASRIFLSVIDALNNRLVPILVFWPHPHEVQKTLPLSFRGASPSCIAITGCFEIVIERPENLQARAQTWSNYKCQNTAKYLIAIAPQGSVTLVSKGWGGRTSDKCLTENCELSNYLIPGDVIIADKGCHLINSIALYQCKLGATALPRGKKQLRMTEIQESQDLASQQIHVENVIDILRNKYTMLQDTQPLTMLRKDASDLTCLDKCVRVACALMNMCPSVVPFE